MIYIAPHRRRAYLAACRVLAVLSAIAGLVYLKWLLLDTRPENLVLFYLLIAAEAFNVIQAAGFWYTISSQRWDEPATSDFATTDETVDVFITVAGEPLEIVEQTMHGALAIRHPRMSVWILDDGRSTDIQALASSAGVGYLTRPDRRGAKAGNINEGLARTHGDFVVIFDADHVPKPGFLEKTMGCFAERDVAFVQTPQSYSNRFTNRVASGAHEQQALFYGPIMRGRTKDQAVFACGTNLIFRRTALAAVGGMPEDSITEDLRVSLQLLKAGYHGKYVPIVLAEGLGPLDVSGYYSQQLRWARGGLEILFKRRPFFRGMRMATRVQFGLSFVYWFTGFAYAAYLVLPVAFLLTGQRPVQAPNQYPIYFLPYIVVTLATMAVASDFKIKFEALWFTLGSFPIHVAALITAIFGGKAKFVVTSKSGSRRSLRPVITHIVAISVLVVAMVVGMLREGITPAVMNNVAFALGHVVILQGFIRYALWPDVRAGEAALEPTRDASVAGAGDEGILESEPAGEGTA
ncbi:MAG TPA: glycosyltransferase [Coriobacteriia bacterium]